MTRLAALLDGAAMLLTGCDLAPHYKVPTVSVPASYRDLAVWHEATPADTSPRADWWKDFNDPVLDQLEQRLNAENVTLAAAEATFAQARASAAEVESGLFPQLNVGGALSANRESAKRPLRGRNLPAYFGANTLSAQFGYEVDFWDQIHNQVVAGTAAAQAGAADLAFARLSLQAELANDYMLLRGLDAQEDLLQHTVAAYTRALDVVQNRYTGKIASGVDLSRAQNQLETARAQLDDLHAQRDVLEHAIATLVAVPAPAFALRPVIHSRPLPKVPASVPSALLQRRPDIAAAERRVAVANATIGVARAAFYPNISLNLSGGTQSTGLDLLSLPNSVWSLGPSLSLPIFRGGLLQAQEAAAVAAYNLAAADYRNTVLTAFQEVQDALAQLHWYGVELEDDKRAVAAAEQTLTMALALYQDGATSYLEVVTAQEAALGAEQLQLQLQTAYLQAGVRLIRALGGGWSTRELPAPDATPLRHVDIAP